MLVALFALDKPQSVDLRAATRDAHVAYLKSSGIVEQAGPLLDDTGGMIGSLLILNVADMDAARAFAAGDPYAKAGLFASVELRVWNRVIDARTIE